MTTPANGVNKSKLMRVTTHRQANACQCLKFAVRGRHLALHAKNNIENGVLVCEVVGCLKRAPEAGLSDD